MNKYQITVTRSLHGTRQTEQFEFMTHLKSNEAVLVKQIMKALTSYYVASSGEAKSAEVMEKIIEQSLALHDPEVLFREARERLQIVDCVVSSRIDPTPAQLKTMAREIGVVVTA